MGGGQPLVLPLAVGAPTGATLFPQLGWMHQDVWSQIFICLGSPSIHLRLSRGLLFAHTYTAKLYICLCTPPLLCLFGAVYYLSVLCYRSSSWRPSVSVYFTLDFYFHPHSFLFFSNFYSSLSSIWPLPPVCSSNNIH